MFRTSTGIALLALPAVLSGCAISLTPFDPADARTADDVAAVDEAFDAPRPAPDVSPLRDAAADAMGATDATDTLLDAVAHGDAAIDASDAIDTLLDANAPDDVTDASLDAAPPDDVVAVDVPQTTPNPLRLLRPTSTARMTSHRPTLYFVPATPSDGTRVEICLDRACQNVVTSIDATGDSVRPPQALPRGVYFWRAWALLGGAVVSEPGPTWEFSVGPRDLAVDTSWGVLPDYNGDGYGDLMVGTFGSRDTLTFFPGGPQGFSHATKVQIPLGATVYGLMPDYIPPVGDVNGDGFVDTAITVGGSQDVRIEMVYGGADGPSPAPDSMIPITLFSYTDYVGSDFDGDGYVDVGPNWGGPLGPDGNALIFRGGPDGLTADNPLEVEPPDPTMPLDTLIRPLVDFNGDGRLEALFVLTTPTFERQMHVFPSGPVLRSAGVITCALCVGTDPDGSALLSVGDLDGDGYADAITATAPMATGNPMFETLFGGPSGLANAGPIRTIPAPPPDTNRTHVHEVEVIGDVDGNGTQDLAALDRLPDEELDLRQWLDPSRGPDGVVMVAFGPSSMRTRPGYGVPSLGDINGDGFDDIEIRDYDVVFLGSPTGIRPDTAFVIYPERVLP